MIVWVLISLGQIRMMSWVAAMALADARKRVDEAGCSVFLAAANGACLLVPLTEEQVFELQLKLTAYHIVALRSDKPAILQALKEVHGSIRPKLKEDHRAATVMDKDRVASPALALAPATYNVIEEVEVLHPRFREESSWLAILA